MTGERAHAGRRWRAAARAAMGFAIALAACREDKHHDELVRRIERLEDTLQKLATEAAAARSQLDDLRAKESRMSLPSAAGDAGAGAAAAPSGDGSEAAAETDTGTTPAGNPMALSIVSRPAGAQVYVDGRMVGTTPLIFTRPAGSPAAKVKLRKRGYRDAAQTLAADQTRLDVRLVPR